MTLSAYIYITYVNPPHCVDMYVHALSMFCGIVIECISNMLLCLCSVTKERTEIVLEGTYNVTLGNYGEAADWLEIEFNCKPGAIDRRPCIISPYHYRLDWLMWFAAFQVAREQVFI